MATTPGSANGAGPIRHRRRARGRALRVVVIGFVTLVVAAAFLIPVPLVVIGPGPTLPLGEDITIGGIPTGELSGEYRLTTVRLDETTPVGALAAMLDPHEDLVPRDQVIPPGTGGDEWDDLQRQVFVESVQLAAAAGLRAAGHDVELTGDGAEVRAIGDGVAQGARPQLQVGDVIVAVDGEPVELAADLSRELEGGEAGDRVTLTVRRDGERLGIEAELRHLPELGHAGLGVAVRTVRPRTALPGAVELDTSGVGGPSGGLMLALAVFDLVDEQDLADGRVIAGTGTIGPDGEVGPISGVEHKVAAAVDAGADVFLAPASQAATAREAAGGDVEVVAAATLEEAIAAL